MRRRPVLNVELNGCASSMVSSHPRDLREMIETVTGRPPVWVHRIKCYAVQEATARDVIALAQLHRWDVVITGPRAAETGGAA